MITMEAYYFEVCPRVQLQHKCRPFFVGLFEVHMTSSLRKEESCLIMRNGSLNIADVLWETIFLTYFSYSAFISKRNSLFYQEMRINSANDYKYWHEVVGHIFFDHYQIYRNSSRKYQNFHDQSLKTII